MTVDSDKDLETQIAEWRAYMRRRRAVHDTDVDELEDHLRATVAELVEAGLRPEEAFLVAVKRMGSLDDLSREFARVHSDRLWKQLVLAGGPDTAVRAGSRRDLLVMVGCAAAAAIGIKVPELFGVDLDDGGFYARNFSLFALVPLAAYFVVRRRVGTAGIGVLLALFALGAIGANAYPLAEDSQSIVLTAIHLPLALWLVVGLAYVGGDWRSERKWMDFIRFTGEWLIYFVLIALGGGILIAVTVGVFDAIGIDVTELANAWILPCGAMGAVVVAAWLVEAKQSVIENMAPVLTRVFTPLFTAALLAFLAAVLWTGSVIEVERDVLILFDMVLVVVLGLLLYAISARDPAIRPGLFDWLQLALAISASLIDVLVLLAITGRITEWGTTPNKAAALGVNLILLANLAWTAFLLTDFIRRRRPFDHLEHWQTRYLAVYAAWAWAVVLVFPLIFSFY
ncbi:MAG TPA: permease prefix domain 1-containing protein [Pilimelia sp.]|nr:permease prefix domain 1-containing protein [Pilimelia sp.]